MSLLLGRSSSRTSASDEERIEQRAQATFGAASYRRGIIVLRFDDIPPTDATVVQPLLAARLLPASFAAVFNRIGGGGNISLAQLTAIRDDGHEIMSHSRTHGVAPADFAAFTDETVGAANDIAALGFYQDTFVQPGTWLGASYNFQTLAALGGEPERLFRSNFAGMLAYLAEDTNISGVKPLPERYKYGATHQLGVDTIPNGDATLAQLQGYVDAVSRFGGLIEVLFHSAFIGQAGHLSLADFTTFLDYLQAARDGGALEVMTATSALWAHQANYAENFLSDPSFEEIAPGTNFPAAAGASSPAWHHIGGVPSVVAGAGRLASGQAALVSLANPVRQEIAADSTRVVRIDAWARNASGGGNITPQLQVEGMQSGNAVPINSKVVAPAIGQAYTQLSAQISASPIVDYWRVTLSVAGGGSAYFDDTSGIRL